MLCRKKRIADRMHFPFSCMSLPIRAFVLIGKLLCFVPYKRIVCIDFIFFVRCSPSHPPFLSLGIGFPQNWLYYPGSRKYFSNLLAEQLVRIISPGKNGEWAEAELIYRAQGGESLMIMGNFLSLSEMEAEGVNLTRTIRYWIDDISLEPVQGNVGESCKKNEQVKAALLADHNRHSRPRRRHE